MITWRVWFKQPHLIHRSIREQRAFSVMVVADQLFNSPSGSAIFLREAADKGAKGKAEMIAYRTFNRNTFAEIHLVDDPEFKAKQEPRPPTTNKASRPVAVDRDYFVQKALDAFAAEQTRAQAKATIRRPSVRRRVGA